MVLDKHTITLYDVNDTNCNLLSDVNSRSSLINPAIFLVFNFQCPFLELCLNGVGSVKELRNFFQTDSSFRDKRNR